MSLNNLIIKIFKSHGFEINSSSDYSQYILASKDNINLSVGYTDMDEEVNIATMRNFFRSAKKDNADRFIYIISGTKYPHAVNKFAEDRNIQLWDRERLERELGRAVLTNIEVFGGVGEFDEELTEISKREVGYHTEPEFAAETGTRAGTTIPGVDSELGSSTEEMPIMVPIIPFDDDGELITTSSETTTETDNIIDASADEPFEDEQLQDLHAYDSLSPLESRDVWIIKPKITKDQAASMASKIVRGFRFNLELIPYYIFNYTCKFESGLPEDAESMGMIGINGLTSNIEEWRGSLKTTRHLDEEHTKLEIKFPYDKALALVREAVVELNTKIVETREESDQTIIFEKKKLKPKSDAIEIESKGLYYLPVWCIEGSNGLMIIDASTGKVIKEDFF